MLLFALISELSIWKNGGMKQMVLTPADVVKKYRIEECGLNQAEMSKVLRTTQVTISEIENGGSISKKMAKKFSALTERTIEFFLKI